MIFDLGPCFVLVGGGGCLEARKGGSMVVLLKMFVQYTSNIASGACVT
jgi:hypothetical protein